MLVLVLYGLASVHCMLEGVPGLEFLETCCFGGAGSTAPSGCENDGCGPVEDGKYRLEEHHASAPLPPLRSVPLAAELDSPQTEARAAAPVSADPPPELPRGWQFFWRTALPPRAPSVAS